MKKFSSFAHHSKQKGQVLVLSVIFMTILFAAVLLVFNIGQLNTEKTRLVSAADAAAYSGGVYFARNLNFLAYTNRAMLANHVAIGHFISYLSWLRYVDDGIDKLDDVVQLLPNVSLGVNYAKELVQGEKESVENFAPVLIESAQQINNKIQDAQLKSQSTMNGVLSVSNLLDVKIMDKVAKSYLPSIRVNFKDDVESIEPEWLRAQIINDMAHTLSFVKRYRPGTDDNHLNELITHNYLESESWIKGNRGWRLGGRGFSLFKEGETMHKMSAYNANWEASDHLYIEWLSRRRGRSDTVAWGQASVSEFNPEYSAISSYYGKRNKDSTGTSLKMTVLATMNGLEDYQRGTENFNNATDKLHAISRVEVYYERPESGFIEKDNDNYANLYNPFWQVRLTKNRH